MKVRWLETEAPGSRDVDGALAVLEAVRAHDFPAEVPLTTSTWLARLRHGWDGEPPIAAVATDDGGRVVGVLELFVPERDNRHMGWAMVGVDPRARRRGAGRALLEAVLTELRRQGRTLLVTELVDGPAAAPFAAAMGLEPASADAARRLDLLALDLDRLGALERDAARLAGDYELVRLTRDLPDQLMPAVVEMIGAINDAPTDDLRIEDETYSVERFHAFHDAQAAQSRTVYHLAARHRGTGELAGHTMVGVERQFPYYGHQFDTSVIERHRGHRLGIVLKAGMLRWLQDAEPQLRVLNTWNAVSNGPMIAVNEALGYELIATSRGYQRDI